MKKILVSITYYLQLTICIPLSLLPLCVLYLFSDLLYFILYYCVGYRKKVVRINLQKSFPDKNKDELRRIEREFYAYFCDYFFETIKVLTISKKQMRKRMSFSGIEEMLDAAQGRSCIAYLGHYCNWEWIASLPLHSPDTLHCGQIYHPLKNEASDRFFLQLRSRFDAECISMNNTLRRIIAMRNEGKQFVIGFIADQTPAWASIRYWIDFLHQDTPVFIGPERIAKQTDSVVYYLEVTRPRRGYYHCHFTPLCLSPNEQPEHAITDMYYQALEKTINNAPQYWLWTHKRWKRQRNMEGYAY